jgi:hypothetical protein
VTAPMAAVEAEVVAADMEVEIVNVTDAEMLATFLGIVRTIVVEITTTKPTIVNRSKFYSGPPGIEMSCNPPDWWFFFSSFIAVSKFASRTGLLSTRW